MKSYHNSHSLNAEPIPTKTTTYTNKNKKMGSPRSQSPTIISNSSTQQRQKTHELTSSIVLGCSGGGANRAGAVSARPGRRQRLGLYRGLGVWVQRERLVHLQRAPVSPISIIPTTRSGHSHQKQHQKPTKLQTWSPHLSHWSISSACLHRTTQKCTAKMQNFLGFWRIWRNMREREDTQQDPRAEIKALNESG